MKREDQLEMGRRERVQGIGVQVRGGKGSLI